MAKSWRDFALFVEMIHSLLCHAVILTLSFAIMGVSEPWKSGAVKITGQSVSDSFFLSGKIRYLPYFLWYCGRKKRASGGRGTRAGNTGGRTTKNAYCPIYSLWYGEVRESWFDCTWFIQRSCRTCKKRSKVSIRSKVRGLYGTQNNKCQRLYNIL